MSIDVQKCSFQRLLYGYFSDVKRTITHEFLSASLTELSKGAHAGKFKITYRDHSGKIRTGGIIKGEDAAKKRAKAILADLIKEKVDNLSPAEARLIQELRENKIQPGKLTPSINTLKTVETITPKEATELFLTREVEGAGYSYEQRKDYQRNLRELRYHFSMEPLSTITLHTLEAWADTWKVGPKRFNNKRTILSSFWKWAVARNYAEKNVAEQLQRKRVPRKASHEVLSPWEFATILTHCKATYLPWLCLSGFAGLRGVEIYGRPDDRNSGLHWEDIDWKRKVIILNHTSAKQTSNSKTRLIPMQDALIDWLEPWKKATGPVHPFGVMRPFTGSKSYTEELGALIGGWKNNALRASRASYRLAQTQSIATVTLEMGHSKDMLLGTYLNPRFEDTAVQWFNLDRAAAKELSSQPKNIISIAS